MRREFEYRRNGTVKLFAAFNVHEGTVAGWVTDSTRSENFVAFLQDLVDQTPAGMELHRKKAASASRSRSSGASGAAPLAAESWA